MLFMMRENCRVDPRQVRPQKPYSMRKSAQAWAGEDYAQGFGAGDVLLVPDVVKRVGLVLQVEEHPGEI